MTYHSSAPSLDALAAELDLLDPDLPVAVAVTDIDEFGPLNAEHGDAIGDAVLERFEHCITDVLPPGGFVAHVRGDEFAVLLLDTSCESALLLLEGARVRFHSNPPAPGVEARLGASFGIAGRPAHGETAAELLEAADSGLVRAKRAGGNQIAIHTEERMILKSSYFPRRALHRLAKLARRTGRPEASLLREALEQYLAANAS